MRKVGFWMTVFVGIIVTVLFIYGLYYIAKTTSYNLFYRAMVESTVVEMVRPDSLRK